MKYRFNFSSINLWCNKNLVDTQFLMWRMLWFSQLGKDYDVNYFADPYEKEVGYVFVNTCGFLWAARKEMLDTLNWLIDLGKKPIVLWCWVQYFQRLDPNNSPEILKKISLLSWNDLDRISIIDIIKWYSSTKFENFEFSNNLRAYTNVAYWFEYIKVAEWCNNSCSFCIIPKIRWKQKSLPTEKVLTEIENILHTWADEIILLSQDTTRYWVDLYNKPYLFELLDEIEKLPMDFKYRLLYLYPDVVTLKQLEKLKSFEKFIPYFDIPLQHISSNVLKRMWRFYDTSYIYKFLEFINQNFENKYIRTNIIVGFPWETDEDFEELLQFIDKWYFDSIAIFEYHDEPMADSSKLDNKVPDEVITKRFNILKDLVDKKLSEKESQRSGEQYGYIMDIIEWNESNVVVRPWLHAPEIDSYDTISFDQITWVYNESGEIDIWTKIIYNI